MVRVYQVDYTLSHQLVMNLLEKNGIGVMVELVTPEVCVNRINPVYTYSLYQQGAKVIDAFHKFANTLLFSVGNEVVFPGVIYEHFKDVKEAVDCEKACASVMKSFLRDMKAYMKTKGYRAVPVGMAMQDGPQASVNPPGLIGTDVVAQFYACGDATQRADYIGINTYRYVNSKTPGPMNSYDGLANEVHTLPIPVVLTESIGVNFPNGSTNPPYTRDWAIVDQTYTEKLLYQNLSGQVAFELFANTETNDFFGLYNQPTDLTSLTPTAYGGADYLATQFAPSSPPLNLPIPPPVTSPSACPPACTPALLPNPAPNITVTVMNYATEVLNVVQNDTVMATLPAAASHDFPTSTKVHVFDQFPLYILQPVGKSWPMVCNVAVNKFANGDTISNNVQWGRACNVSSS